LRKRGCVGLMLAEGRSAYAKPGVGRTARRFCVSIKAAVSEQATLRDPALASAMPLG
jgi:hypothetical protein